jgi:hypothetical protein
MSLLVLLPVINLGFLGDDLSSESLLGNESLDLWSLVESLVSLLDFSSNNILGNIILLSESESLSNVSNSLWTESSWSLSVGKTLVLVFSLNENFEGNNSKIWSTDASSA